MEKYGYFGVLDQLNIPIFNFLIFEFIHGKEKLFFRVGFFAE
jgi:hypothetical protein